MKYIKNNNLNFDENLIKEYSKKFDLDNEIIKLLFSRGFDNERKIEDFLSPKVTNLHNPFLLKNMREVVDKINYYVANNKRITILGDYDTDGISASAILYKYFQSIGINVDVFLPQRLLDGYGLSNDTIDKIIKLYNPDLIITVDCGISSYKEVEYCKEKGIDIIITDHHDIPDILPDTLIVNAKLPNQMYPFHELCGAGVAMKLVQALAGLEKALEYATIASLATVADIVPLIDENRAIVYLGLANQDKYLPVGLKKLCKQIGAKLPLNTGDISFKLSPKLNAPGRMGDAIISFNVFVENDDKKINDNINELLRLNDERVVQTNNIYNECLEMLKDVNVSSLGAIVLYNDNWEGGVLGIICSKLVDRFNKPVCLLSRNDHEFKGSVRSINGINVYNILNEIKHILLRFGGHNQAGGLSVHEDNIEEFAKLFNATILKNHTSDIFVPVKKYDMEIPKNISVKFLEQLDRLEPFGLSNERPIFLMSLNDAKCTRLTNFQQHLKVKSGNLEVMAFNMGQYYYNLNSNCNKQALVDLHLEKFKNSVKIKGVIRHLNFSQLNGMKKSDIPYSNYLSQLKYIKNKRIGEYLATSLSYNQLVEKCNELTQNYFGTCIVTYNFNTYQKILKNVKNIQNYEMFEVHNTYGCNTLLFAPNHDVQLKLYENIVLFDLPLCDGYLHHLNNNVYVIDEPYNVNIYKALSTDRQVFGHYHNAIKDAIEKGVNASNLVEYFSLMKKLNPNFSSFNYKQFTFVLLVLQELGILAYDGLNISFTGLKNDLKNSTIYNNVLLMNKL